MIFRRRVFNQKMKMLKNMLEYAVFRIVIFLCRLLPYHSMEKFISWLFVSLSGLQITRGKLADSQLKSVFPEKSEKEIRTIRRASFKQMGITVAETYLAEQKKLLLKCSAPGWEKLEKALALKKGVILVTAHFGNWELAGQYVASRYQPFSVIIKKQRNRYFNEYTNKPRMEQGIRLIYLRQSFREILKVLRENGIVAILTDQNAGRIGIRLPFLGIPASVHTGFAKIAQKTGAVIIPGFAVRNGQGEHSFYIEDFIDPANFRNDEKGVVEITRLVSLQLEKYILKYPEQWFWVHKRWKGAEKAESIVWETE